MPQGILSEYECPPPRLLRAINWEKLNRTLNKVVDPNWTLARRTRYVSVEANNSPCTSPGELRVRKDRKIEGKQANVASFEQKK